MEVLCTMSRGNATCGKKYFHERIHQVTRKILCGAMHGHVCKNKVVPYTAKLLSGKTFAIVTQTIIHGKMFTVA